MTFGNHRLDAISRAPDMNGPAGKAWLVNIDEVFANNPALAGKPHAQVAAWLVEAPYAHPLWHSYGFSLIHTGKVPGLDECHLYVPGATHELVIFALDPDKSRDGALRTNLIKSRLEPINFGAQFIASSNELAIERVRGDIQLVIDGQLSPDTDYRSMWIAKYGDNMVRA